MTEGLALNLVIGVAAWWFGYVTSDSVLGRLRRWLRIAKPERESRRGFFGGLNG